jgi:UDP-N-acetylglucosamine 4,6-dehydratase/5-epimerase
MGMSKALMEKTAQAFARNHPRSPTRVCVTRYGNVMYSRGSVIPLFIKQLKNGQPLTVTDPLMTRFMMTLAESVALVEYAFTHAESGDLLIRKSPGCTIETLVAALGRLFRIRPEVEVIGVRHGEKIHETLATSEELARSTDTGGYFRISLDARGLDYAPYFEEGQPGTEKIRDYGSDSTYQLSIDETEALLLQVPEVNEELTGRSS